MSAPDHAENTGDNLRHAAELQEQAKDAPKEDVEVLPGQPEQPLPDFNT